MSGGTSEEQYAGRQPRGHIITKSEDIQRDLVTKTRYGTDTFGKSTSQTHKYIR